MDKVTYAMPFAKVDEQRRIVSGFATLNNLDKQKDIVNTEASIKAFKSFRGNIRELHSKIAAGRLLDYGVTQYHDIVTNKVYDGIFVRAYISKGAPDTWEKVLDGTLNGFSIGGEILDAENIVDDEGNMVRVIKEYELAELSLVDNPANPLANVVSIEKAHSFFTDFSHTEEKEMNDMANVKKSADDVVVEPVAEVEVPVVEETVVEPEATVVVEEVAVEEAPEEPVVEDPKAELADETFVESVEQPEAVDKADEVSEAGSDAAVLANAINEIKALFTENSTKTADAFGLIVEQLKELSAGVEATKADLVSVKSTVSEFDKRVVAVEEDTAVRKSGDLGEVAQGKTQTQKSLWGGRFLAADL